MKNLEEAVVNIELDAAEAEALCSIVHPVLASILNKEGIDDIIKGIREKDITVFENMSPIGQRAFVASIAICKVEMELKKLMEDKSHATATAGRA